MAKDTFIHRIKKNFFTRSLRHAVLVNSTIFLLFLIIFNLFALWLLAIIIGDKIDRRLVHESDRLKSTIEISGDSLVFISATEIMEPDFKDSTEHPFLLRIYNTRSDLIYESLNHNYFSRLETEIPDSLSKSILLSTESEGSTYRLMLDTINDRNGNVRAVLQLAVFESDIDETREEFLRMNLVVLPFFILLIFILSIFLAKRTYRPLEQIILVAASISASNIKNRVSYDAEPEDILGRLRDTINDLFERLDLQINQISQFTDNASHQLMNPLTAVKSELEYILKKRELPPQQLETIAMVAAQTDKMIEIIRSLLIISRSHKNLITSKAVVSFSKVLNDYIKTSYPGLKFAVENDIYIKGTEEYVRIVAENLIENAIKYSHNDSGGVKVTLIKKGLFAELSVADNGMGIPDSDKEHIFERFYRSKDAEKMGIRGFGLGLSLVKTIVTLAGGTITIEDNKPSGSVFVARFPVIILGD